MRTGGVAGTRLTVTLDTEQLPPEEADRLSRLIAAAALFDQPPSSKSGAPGADRFQYRVTVEEGDRRQNVAVDESSAPKALRPLLDYLIDAARARLRTKRS